MLMFRTSFRRGVLVSPCAATFRAGRAVQVLAITGASSDHPVGLDALEGSYLKAVWLLMGDTRELR